MIPRPGTELPAGDAEMVSVIDGHMDRWEIEVVGGTAGQPAGDGPQSPMVPIRNMRLLTASEAA